MIHKRRFISLLLSLLLVAGFVIWEFFNPTVGIESEAIAISLDSERSLIAQIYAPKNSSEPQSVMILCHGVNNSKEMMAPLAMELARHGIAAIAFDFGGFGESYQLPGELKSVENLEENTIADAKAVLDFVGDRFLGSRIGIGGHSMGGNTALKLAGMEKQLRATIVLSMSGYATATSPANLLLGAGVYEQLNPTGELRSSLKQATDNDSSCINHGICGDFKAGTARKLVISGTTDHVSAPYDPLLMRQVINWAQQALELPVSKSH